MSGFKRAPVGTKPETKSESAFIEAAGKPAVTTVLPWVGLDDEKSRELYNLRFTAAEKAKLEYIVANTKFKSMQEYCMHILKPAMDAEIARLTGETESQPR